MNALKYLILFLILFSFTSAQQFVPPPPNNADNIPNFNFSEIKTRKIKSIVYDVVDKKDFQIAEDKDLSRHYEFDSLGRLTRCYYTVISRIIQKEFRTAPITKHRRVISSGSVYYKNVYEFDTLSCIFLYDVKSNLTCKRFNDGNYYNANYYWYDSLNRVTRMLSCKETNASPDKSVFALGTQQVLLDERYKYVVTSENQYKQLCLNDENRVYKEIIVNLNKNKKPLQYNESFVTAWVNQVTSFSYNENNLLTQKIYASNAGGKMELKETYEYKNSLLDTEKRYKNNILQIETGYVYDSETKMLNSFVSRDPINKTMQIVKLIYAYY